MPKRRDIKNILIIGSGPIIIGQACEFDYSGTQACRVLMKEGYRTVLINSNPATIMTDPEFSHRTYIEPITVENVEKIIIREKIDSILTTVGGQTALNITMELHRKGILEKYNIALVGANIKAILKAETRELFRQSMEKIGLKVCSSSIIHSINEVEQVLKTISFPMILRPAFTLGGTGGGIACTKKELYDMINYGLNASPISEVLVEEFLVGWKEYELEVVRDLNDNVIIICSIENIDPMGIHTGDSITVAPAQTLSDIEYQQMRDAAIKVIREIGVDTGGSNIQFAVNPDNGDMVIVEMNPRVSRSSALASKATGFPIAKIAAKLAVGYTLDEIPNDITRKTPACFEPVLDYVVVKIPRFAFEKFLRANDTLDTAMKSVGEVMAVGRTFNEALQKAIRGLEIGRAGLGGDGLGLACEVKKIKEKDRGSSEFKNFLKDTKFKLKIPNCDRIFNIRYGLELGLTVDDIYELSKIDRWFIHNINELILYENKIKENSYKLNKELVLEGKRTGYSDFQLAHLFMETEETIRNFREKNGILPNYNLIDTCSAEFESYTPYYYSTYEDNEDFTGDTSDKKVIIIGSGPNRIGQGIEFDYCCVQASLALKSENIKSILVNSNPETVSTDYDISDKLYFEPVTAEDIYNIYKREKAAGIILQFGGSAPIKMAMQLKSMGLNILGTQPEVIDLAEDRDKFYKKLNEMGIPKIEYRVCHSVEETIEKAKTIGLPVLIRPSYVLGGTAMEIIYREKEIKFMAERVFRISDDYPVIIDKFLQDAVEIDVDALCDGDEVFIAGIMEHIEEAGIHSGDSACVTPPVHISEDTLNTIRKYTEKAGKEFNIVGIFNIQFAVKDGIVYIIEINPRASRTVPFISKATGIPAGRFATLIAIGKKIKDLKITVKENNMYSVKEVVLPFKRFKDVDILLGPEMKSTGEVMGTGKSFGEAFYKAHIATGVPFPLSGNVLVMVSSRDKPKISDAMKELFFNFNYTFIASEGTGAVLKQNGLLPDRIIDKKELLSFIMPMISRNEISMIINTSENSRIYREGFEIRRAAMLNNIPVITTINGVKAFSKALKACRTQNIGIYSLQEIHDTFKM